jgi:hypothetical protein
MGHTLTLDIPEEVYESLFRKAKQAGRTPEDMVLEWLTRSAQGLADDPLLQLAGTFESALTDVSDRHDDYIGQGLREELRGSDHG